MHLSCSASLATPLCHSVPRRSHPPLKEDGADGIGTRRGLAGCVCGAIEGDMGGTAKGGLGWPGV
eukprot:4531088-Prorocentrum_lima.AAC.1